MLGWLVFIFIFCGAVQIEITLCGMAMTLPLTLHNVRKKVSYLVLEGV